jgi:hypothetical protein
MSLYSELKMFSVQWPISRLTHHIPWHGITGIFKIRWTASRRCDLCTEHARIHFELFSVISLIKKFLKYFNECFNNQSTDFRVTLYMIHSPIAPEQYRRTTNIILIRVWSHWSRFSLSAYSHVQKVDGNLPSLHRKWRQMLAFLSQPRLHELWPFNLRPH